MTKSDIDSIIGWLIDQSFDGNIDIRYPAVFKEQVREVFRELHKMNCKNFAGGECLKGGRCDGNCPRMKNYDKKH
jgi:hypothetical protein